jgi:hypothetical protein
MTDFQGNSASLSVWMQEPSTIACEALRVADKSLVSGVPRLDSSA